MAHLERVIILIDMDCFYCQVEEKLDKSLEGKPIAVVQYNEWRGGGIIAVNYPARDRGVTRHMRGQEAKEKCPEIALVKVPNVRGKADLSKYRDAGKEVASVLQKFTDLLERASVDEAYLDVTSLVATRMKQGINQISIDKLSNTYVVGCDTEEFLKRISSQLEYTENNCKLAFGGMIAEEIRAEVFKQTGYKCSAGIAHNKILAKLVCGLHKPNKQTILPHDAVTEFFQTLPLRKVKSLGGKFGKSLSEDLGITNMGELFSFSEKQLLEKYGKKNGTWLYNIARGINYDPVVTRLVSKSIGCCKRFPGKTALLTHEDIQHWMEELAEEISERLSKDLEENNRRAKQMVINFSQEVKNENLSNSRTHPLNSYEKSQIAKDAIEVVRKCCQKADGSYHVTFLGISVGNFQDIKKTKDITSFFKNSIAIQEAKKQKFLEEKMQIDQNELPVKDLVLEEDNEETGNHSVYSASTDEFDEDPKSYIYFEDIYPECVSSQPLENNELPHKSDPSISKDKTQLDTRVRPAASFFSKYFDKMEFCESPILNIKEPNCLDMETSTSSLNLSSGSNESAKTSTKKQKVKDSTSGLKRKTSENNILQYFSKFVEPNENYCEECKRNIPVEDIPDHSDYHVAKTLQAELNKAVINDDQSTNKNITPKNESYCEECKRNIPVEEVPDHSDYHVAKSLQEELNKTVISDKSSNKNITGTPKNKSSNKSISDFFKPK